MKRSFFGALFNPRVQPGFEARYNSEANKLTGGACIKGGVNQPVNWGVSESDLKKAVEPQYLFNSGTVNQTLPSRILRKKGWVP